MGSCYYLIDCMGIAHFCRGSAVPFAGSYRGTSLGGLASRFETLWGSIIILAEFRTLRSKYHAKYPQHSSNIGKSWPNCQLGICFLSRYPMHFAGVLTRRENRCG